ncbi:hypothetical protein [Shewanella sp. 10N.286.52.B9]|uniref:hypothetical protein n=1 Tax=Shewanella sp. 10N.286.52.B9 TaxID=1880837 RepID=UPI000C85799E|nr:hypothetical protein [Shewanella sp. 10N.286.52.B9]PMG45785.1 hypothetical protein BCU91_19675 [Shewanella sp. 10N.286.52.B9]
MNNKPKLDNETIWVFKCIVDSLNPVSKWIKLDKKVSLRLDNLSDGEKNTLSKVYLSFFLVIGFLLIWLNYHDFKSIVNELSVYKNPLCDEIYGEKMSCGDTTASYFVKGNVFKLTAALEVSFLLIGVIWGNIGWDRAALIKSDGVENLSDYMTLPIVLSIICFSISYLTIDLLALDNGNFIMSNSKSFMLIPIILFFLFMIFLMRVARKKVCAI